MQQVALNDPAGPGHLWDWTPCHTPKLSISLGKRPVFHGSNNHMNIHVRQTLPASKSRTDKYPEISPWAGLCGQPVSSPRSSPFPETGPKAFTEGKWMSPPCQVWECHHEACPTHTLPPLEVCQLPERKQCRPLRAALGACPMPGC